MMEKGIREKARALKSEHLHGTKALRSILRSRQLQLQLFLKILQEEGCGVELCKPGCRSADE